MTVQEGNSTSLCGAEHSGKVTVALVSKYAPEGIGGIQNHLDMLLRHVQTPNCSYVFVTGCEGEAERSGRAREYLRFVRRLMRCRWRASALPRLRPAAASHPHAVHTRTDPSRGDSAQRCGRDRQRPEGPPSAGQAMGGRTAIPGADPATRARHRAQRGRARLLSRPVSPLRPPRGGAAQPDRGSRLGPPAACARAGRACWHLPGSIREAHRGSRQCHGSSSPAVECDIAGPDCGAAAALQDQARQVARTIRFHGAVRGAEKERLFEDAAVVVVPSHAEGLSTVALEALARGIPVVASDCAARGLPAEGVYRYPFRSVTDLVRTIEHLLEGENLLLARHAARRASAELVGYDDYAEALRSLYRLSVDRHRSGITPRGTHYRWRLRPSPRDRRSA